jgi:hypothetical protein
MTSQPIRNHVVFHMITPKNAALLIIDYQPHQVSSIVSMDHRTLVSNIVAASMCELQRDWARTETVQPLRELLFTLESR